MQVRWRSVVLGAAMAAVAGTAGCGAADGSGGSPSAPADEVSATSAAPAPPSVYGEPMEPSREEPAEVATDPPPSPGPPTGDTVSVALTYAGWNATTAQVEVDGYVPGVLEHGGTCTLTLTSGPTTVTASVPGTPNVSDTDCGGAAVSRDRLSPGTWTAVLGYRSGTSIGSSAATEVTVP
jgi:hypothetical protein